MICTTTRWRRLAVTGLSLPLALALSGTALASEPTAELIGPPALTASSVDLAPEEPAEVAVTSTDAGDDSAPQPISKGDSTGNGANPGGEVGDDCAVVDPDNAYCSTRDGSPSENGVGDGGAVGKPCAGCVGSADNKNPPGQAPDGTDPNAGYECDRNQGVGVGNPAHTSCEPEAPEVVEEETTEEEVVEEEVVEEDTTEEEVVEEEVVCPTEPVNGPVMDGCDRPTEGGATPITDTPPGQPATGPTPVDAPETPAETPAEPVFFGGQTPPTAVVANTGVAPTVVQPVRRPQATVAPEALPRTGASTALLSLLGGLLVLVGGAAMVAGRPAAGARLH